VSPPSASASVGKRTAFKATATMSDGTTQDVTTTATWTSSDPAVASIDRRGSATPLARGTTTLTAAHGDASGAASLVVEDLVVEDGPIGDTIGGIGGIGSAEAAELLIPWR